MTPAVDCDVAIVGAGPAGAAVAVGLHRAGLRVRLLDREPVRPLPGDYDARVYALSPASVDLLDVLGVWPAVSGVRASPYTHMQVWENEPAQSLHFDAADARRPLLGHIVEHGVLVQALLAALPPALLQVPAEVTGCRIDADAAVLELGDGSRLRARLVVAADGPQSALRGMLGVDLLRSDYDQTAVVCHVSTERPHQQAAYQRFLDTGPLALLPLADGRSSLVWSTTEAAALLAMDETAFCATLAAASQHVLGGVLACSPRRSFPLQLQQAERYAGERFALAGDAAHVVHPLAGQGLNLGFGDARVLVETLTAAREARRDPGSARVLGRYQRARLAATHEMMAITDGLYRAWRLQLPGWRWLRQRGLQSVNALAPLRQALVRRACDLS
ncbi:FAD-dependent monooxygenase [Sinimarinibacterium flocculans]|uniref:2-octaprenyl-6-methoxyphenol hydroxylase /2-octaprenyl-3-methyl-6-methoxy-1,4-benzoquinol hydroxylase n=1 Tax=Sinimarinibacterium flocculans TaxID=985250 RepID=A0A318E4N7_9GAMM|nr:FAD-dependent monooxygenase [Sinimarinibacterium flocculans]PXV66127.1 2-octaprenyl-6-methoxyphenol hydroxylase /2-octaprenyl-3-methyl-6-methoxy-1,4-benzoquinol hydroxylase [Sinimarinibacterium flocculans]